MSVLWFLRHGQAGTRHDYDRLSPLGLEQAAELGACLAREAPRPAAFFSGALRRQRETAERVLAAYRAAGLACPDPVVDARWNEFDLDEVFAGIAPLLAAEDAEFARQWDEVQGTADAADAVHRTWTEADAAVMRAWIENRFPRFAGESWPAFNQRVLSTRSELARYAPGDHILIATSGTPTAIWMAQALEIPTACIMRLAGAAINCNYTVLQLLPDRLDLLCFNAAAHVSTRTRR